MLDTVSVSFDTTISQAPGASSAGMALSELPLGTAARVLSVAAADSTPAEVGRRLTELGFLPGESVRIIARGLFSRAPLAVRIGTGTYALRVFEAACVRVCLERA